MLIQGRNISHDTPIVVDFGCWLQILHLVSTVFFSFPSPSPSFSAFLLCRVLVLALR